MKQFDSNKFYNSFNIQFRALQESERITKDALRSLSRECLMLIHYESKHQGDISPVNKLLGILTPINKKTFVLFMQEFSGFSYDEKAGVFLGKNKRHYDEHCKKACDALDNPHFNLWTWAEMHIKVEKKAFKIETIGKDVKKAMEQEDENGNLLYSKTDILKAVMAGGITTDDLIELLQLLDVVEVQ